MISKIFYLTNHHRMKRYHTDNVWEQNIMIGDLSFTYYLIT